jgi:hypothetical protein
MLDEISDALDTVDPTARKRLIKCVQVLRDALTVWNGRTTPGSLTIAAATPTKCVILTCSTGWPSLAANTVKRGDAALALTKAIENDAADLVVAASAVLLGEKALAAHAADVAHIAQSGRRALTVLLIEQRGRTVTSLVTTVELPPGVTLH